MWFALTIHRLHCFNDAQQRASGTDDPAETVRLARTKFKPNTLMVVPDNCVNPKQQAALEAKRSQKDRELQQWVAKQSMAELCRRTGNC